MIELAVTSSASEISPTLALNETVAARRAKGESVLQMGFGESPFPVPVLLRKALQENAHLKQYLPSAGLEDLRKNALKYYQDKTGIDAGQFDVIVAPGSKLILYALQHAVKGDLLMPVPSWVSYEPQARMLGTYVIKVPTTLDDDGYHIEAETLKRVIEEARASGKNPGKIILNYPNNPTGLNISEEELAALADVCVTENILIISDEIYGFVTFDKTYRSIAKYAPAHTAITTGLSKHLSLGGWRIGIGLIPKGVEGLQKRLCTIASETWSCVPAPIQQASVEAYKGHAEIEKHIGDCCEIHRYMNGYMAEALRHAGIDCPKPQGAFYTYPDFAPFKKELAASGVKTSKALADILMKNYGIAALPGVSFGAEPEVLTLRLSACDYGGEKALQAYQEGAALDEMFLKNHAPHIHEAAQIFHKFIQDVTQKKRA